VDTAAKPELTFFVQVCIFSEQSVIRDEEIPEFIPPELLPPPPPTVPDTDLDHLRWFFAPGRDARTHKQRELVAVLGQTLRGRRNVLWELGNELRIGNVGHEIDQRNLATWLLDIRQALIDNTGSDINVTTSTGVNNEAVTLETVPLTFFDFHSGQWEVNDHYLTGIPQAKQRATSYNPAATLIINDDGISSPPSNMPRNQPNVTAWARTAFQNGCHYNTKGSYPPAEQFSQQQLAGLRDANNSVP
jgi:hypothetical protein